MSKQFNPISIPKYLQSPLLSATSAKDLNSPSLKPLDEFPIVKPAELELLKCSPLLDKQINQVIGNQDALDTSDFKLNEYFNRIFPNADSLGHVETVLENLKQHQSSLDDKIVELVRDQTNASQESQKKIDTVNKSIQDLVSKIRVIKQQASRSEDMIREITNDIKQLDHTKKNLQASISILKRTSIVGNAIDNLKLYSQQKQYEECAEVLLLTKTIIGPLKDYRNVKQIAYLLDAFQHFQLETKKSIMRDFESSLNSKAQASLLHDSCLLLELMEIDAKSELVNWFIDLTLKDYFALFRQNPEVAGLGDVSRRYSWLKRSLKTFDESFTQFFPEHWKIAELLTERFCIETKKDLDKELQRDEAENKFDTKTMLACLEITREFEAKVNLRFNPPVLLQGAVDPEFIPKDSKFYKIISTIFEPYLWHYVDMEDAVLSNKMEGYVQDQSENEEDGVLSSSVDLFIFYRQTLSNCLKLSNQKPFLDLIKMYQKWLDQYKQILLTKLPKEQKQTNDLELHQTCVIINTLDYCAQTTGQLEERVMEMIDKGFTSLVSFQTEIDGFVNAAATGLQCLVRLFETMLEPCLINMTKRPWGTISSVGDQSEYITQIAQQLKPSILLVRKLFSGGKFFRTFCDKFTESFTAKFHQNIFKCKPLSETGAEQMLLDMHSLKNVLTDMSILGDEEKKQPSSTFLKILNKSISKIEQLLKVVLRPQDPAEALVETYNLLYSDYDLQMFTKILELKGIKRIEMQHIIEVFQQRMPANAVQPTIEKPTFKFMKRV
ncbi:Vps53-like protein [Gorgonomyces haynaldii]|nr:Vps53-like protein [Gorgonomyces haynaldii]